MTTATRTQTQTDIDTTLTREEYQPLRSYLNPKGSRPTVEQRAANAEATEEIRVILTGAGYVEYDGRWYGRDCSVKIVADIDTGIHAPDLTTMGVEIHQYPGAAYYWHTAHGTYDALPLAEKFRLGGGGGSTLEAWLATFDRHGMARPGDGCR